MIFIIGFPSFEWVHLLMNLIGLVVLYKATYCTQLMLPKILVYNSNAIGNTYIAIKLDKDSLQSQNMSSVMRIPAK